MEFFTIVGFASAAFLLAIMPGPDNIYVLTESISKGWKQGVGITCGLISGVSIHTTLVATGFSLIIFEYEWVFLLIKIAGAAYLVYLAIGAIREAKPLFEAGISAQTEAFPKLFRRGFLMNVLNPKVTLFFMVLLPQFVQSDGWSSLVQMMVLGGIFMLTSFPVFASIALLAGRVSSLFQSNTFWTATKWMKVAVLTSLAILLIFAQPV